MISLAIPVLVCQLLPVTRSGDGIPDNPFSFRVSMGETAEVVASDGSGTSGGISRRRFALPVDNAEIQNLYAAKCASTRVFVYELGDEEDGWSVAVGIDRVGRVSYRTGFGGFNLAKPAVEGRYAYLATIGFVGKLDLSTGRMLWSHRDLYQRDNAFNSFDEPSVGPTDVMFRARQVPAGPAKTIVVDKKTGAIRGAANGG